MLINRTSLVLVFGLAVPLYGCDSSDGNAPNLPPPAPGEFESAGPNQGGLGRGINQGSRDGERAAPTSTAPPNGSGTAVSESDDDAARAIEEADVVQLQDGKLYALSRYGGLSVVDVSRRDSLRLLGRHKVVATPFEMYVREGIVFALYNGYGQYAYEKATKRWNYYETSQVVALDARDPTSIQVLGRFELPGAISDSRIVGDVLYVAAYENGSCWGCVENRPRTNLISLDVSAPASISKVDELSLPDRTGNYSWKRSLSATDRRLYLAGPTWGPNEPIGSTIQVVDITDPEGSLREGDSVSLGGQIQSRWQMEEFEGVLRVVSQPFGWRQDTPPRIETFEVVSSDELRPLGATDMVLPRPEELQSVRFDGTRAYAVTFERTDPLFTIDLSNPALPRQVGELEMPGFLYHMEPRGDRLLGLGFDQGNAKGSLTVSLFDVEDLAKPSLLSRVNFGGDWASLAEEQDQIHKAFNVLDSAGLVLVPFSGYTRAAETPECWSGSYTSGVQLIDWSNDALDLRGIAPAKGQARRAILHDERLLTMSDERVESFDITDRGAPETTASLPLAQFVNHTQGAGSNVIRVGQSWWDSSVELDVTTLQDVTAPSALGRLELSQVAKDSCYGGSWLGDVYSSESAAYLFYEKYSYDPRTGKESNSSRVVTIDVSDPSTPAVAADTELGFAPTYTQYLLGSVDSGARVVNLGSTLVMANRTFDSTSARFATREAVYLPKDSELKLIDLSEPSAPVVTNVPLRPAFAATGLLLSGSVVATSQFEALTSDFTRVRFFLERLDLTDPQKPVLEPRVNIPGSLLAYDAESAHAVTVDYRNQFLENVTAQICSERYPYGEFLVPNNAFYDYQRTLGRCRMVSQTLRLVRIQGQNARILDSYELAAGERVGSTALGDDRLFIALASSGHGFERGGGVALGSGDGFYYGFQSQSLPLLVLGGIRTGSFSAGRLEIEAGDGWGGYAPLVASGMKAALAAGFRGKLTVIDGTRAGSPTVVREVELPGYVQDLDIVGGSAIVSLGQDGTAAIALDD